MADETAPAVVPAPVATSPAEPPKPKLDLGITPKLAPVEVKADAPTADAELVKQLAKASAGERAARKLVADMQTKLEAQTGTATEAQTKAALWDKVQKQPRLLLEHGVTWDQVLADISGTVEEVPDPKYEAMKAEQAKLQARLDARDKAEADAKEAAAQAGRTEQEQAAHAKVAALMSDEGQKPDADGVARWAIVSQDPGEITQAIDKVVKAIELEQSKDPKFECSHEDALDAVRQWLDHREATERKKLAPLLAAERAKINAGVSEKSQLPVSKPRAPLPPDRYTIDDSVKSDPPPNGIAKANAGPKTRPAAF